jgi:hypothetical protein
MGYNRRRGRGARASAEGVLAELAQRMVLEALTRAAAQPAGLPLFAARGGAGLFTLSAAGKQAARRCQDAGLLRVIRKEPRGRSALEVCDLTDKGLAYLLDRDDLPRAIASRLAEWDASEKLGDCPLPELLRALRAASPMLTIGQFHDRLRLMVQGGKIYLHPWTGPLYELPEPAYALLVGHEIAYYASLREKPPSLAASCKAASDGSEDFP